MSSTLAIGTLRFMGHETSYVFEQSVRCKHHELIDVPSIVSACTEKWWNQTLTEVDSSVVRLAIIEGEFHWHKHTHEDEFFFVLEGRLLIDLEDQTIELGPKQGVTIRKGVMHRPRAPQKTVVLLVEANTVTPVGD